MISFLQVFSDHPTVTAFGLYLLFNAFVAGMPDPVPGASVGYAWAYRSFHALALNLNVFWQRKGLMPAPDPQPGQTVAASQEVVLPTGAMSRTTVLATGAPPEGTIR